MSAILRLARDHTKCPSGDKEYADSEEEIGEDDSELQEGITGF
jgi:hypothetical protein